MNDRILDWAMKIQSIAQTGLAYCRDEFDRERYTELRELSAGWRELVLTGYALSCGYAPRTADGVGELLTTALEGTAWRAENLRLTRAAEALADTVPEVLPLSDRWDDLCTLALVLGQRR